MKKVLLTVVVALAAALILGLIFIYSGVYNVGATHGENGLVRWVANTTMDHSVRAHAAGISVPSLEDTALVNLGFDHYREMCVDCHGSPAGGRGEVSLGLNPPPPDLAEAAKDWSPGELYWIVKNGVKMTGMPGFGPTHDEKALWAIVAFVRQLPAMTADKYRAMEAARPHHMEEGEEGD